MVDEVQKCILKGTKKEAKQKYKNDLELLKQSNKQKQKINVMECLGCKEKIKVKEENILINIKLYSIVIVFQCPKCAHEQFIRCSFQKFKTIDI